MTDQLVALAGLRARPMRERLGPGPSPEQIALRAAGSDRLVCLSGSWAGGGAIVTSDPMLVLDPADDAIAALATQPRIIDADVDADVDVVGGGWFGWLSYDGRHRMAFYDNVLRLVDGQWYFEALHTPQRDAALAQRLEDVRALLTGGGCEVRWSAGAAIGAEQAPHLEAVERAIENIRAGEIYQVNICTRMEGSFAGEPVGFFATAAAALQPSYAAHIESVGTDGRPWAIASMSPELFLRRRGRAVRTSPIKGTWRREPGSGDAGARALRASAKDAAENVMIVDLMRNDLGRVAETGSVHTSSLLDVEAHPGVWHLVSTVDATLRAGVSDADLMRATFPPGSVTGTPKQRAIEIITELESYKRGIYTGAVGFASPCWGLEFSVAIRTFEIARGTYRLGVGGGITADSVPMREWRECLDKASPLLAAAGLPTPHAGTEPTATGAQRAGGLLETVLVRDALPVRLGDHLARLDRSMREVYGTRLPADLTERVHAAASAVGPGRSALRVIVTADQIAVSCAPLGGPPAASNAVTVGGRTGLWRHKWADRTELEAAEVAAGAGVPLFVGTDGSLLETSRGNLFVLQSDGSLLTPALTDDVLPGITRRAVLDLARDAGRTSHLQPVHLDDLRSGVPFWTSSLSGAVPIHSVDSEPMPRDDAAVAAISTALIGGEMTVR